MTLQELFDTLDSTLQKLEEANIDEPSKWDLEILVLHLKREMYRAVFNPLKELDKVGVVDTSELTRLAGEVQGFVRQEERRSEVVTKLVATARLAIQAAGVDIPA
jgi:hypothetical protein